MSSGSAELKRRGARRTWWRRVLRVCILAVITFYGLTAGALILLRWINPPATTVQMQRRLEALAAGKEYRKRYSPVPLARISPNLQHAVIAAEDARFYRHRGIDWKEVEKLVADDIEEGRLGRGGSTITQQLVKNLFLTTHRSLLRKAVEFTLAPLAELVLPKRRILELYLNVIEWGPGVWGAEAAAAYHYRLPASRLSREQSARLAAVLPSPHRRRPAAMDSYSAKILARMSQMSW